MLGNNRIYIIANQYWYDYGARFYDPALGRWHVPDPATEVRKDLSPYRYGFNNPVRYIDVDGRFELDNPNKYSRLSNYLKNGIDNLLMNNRVMTGLSFYGDLSRSRIAQDFQWGSGPKIVIVENLEGNGTDALGMYNRTTPGVIYLDKAFADKLENASKADADAMLLWVIVTILHEYVHLGDYEIDNIAKDYEAGHAFEEWVYGKSIHLLSDSKEILEEYLQRQEEEKNSEQQKEENQQAWDDANNLSEGRYTWDGEQWVSEE